MEERIICPRWLESLLPAALSQTIGAQMRLGDLLIRAKRVTEADVAKALERGNTHGGRLGDNLIAIGAIDEQTLASYLHRIPEEPADIAATGIDETELINLLM